MEKRKRIESINREILLPEAIIQHIQSFLSGKEAAQTCILSKSWYNAWLTRPNLDFNQRDFQYRSDGSAESQITHNGFSKLAERTMKRYEESNLKIDSFRLCSEITDWDSYSLAHELIVRALKMGATDLDFKLFRGTSMFVLPHEVLESEALIRLSVTGCRIEYGKVSCSRLKSLFLREVHLEGDMILDIYSSCPLIEKSVLSECKSFVIDQSYYGVTTRKKMLALSPSIEFEKQNSGSVVDAPIILFELHMLKCLFLDKVRMEASFFSDFSSKFPCLKDLTLHHCYGYNKEIQIYSHSLECISFAQNWILKAIFDVPSIRKFNFSGSNMPSLYFKTASMEWESDISIKCKCPSTSWFLKLNKLLMNLGLSKIFLSVDFEYKLEKSFYYTEDIAELPKPVVEGLMLSMRAPSSVCSALLDCLFWSCRPEFIVQYWLPKSGRVENANNDCLEILFKGLVQGVSENCLIPNQNMFRLYDLVEVNVELFEESLAEWRPLPRKTLLDGDWSLLHSNASTFSENEQMVRFQLRWGVESSEFK